MRRLIDYLTFFFLLLFLATRLFGQADIRSNLINAPESVPKGQTFVVQLKGDIPFNVDPMPSGLIKLRDDEGNRVLLILNAESPGYKISVNHVVVHPTEDELRGAPLEDKAKLLNWMKSHSDDEIFQDEHTVKVGKQPEPDPKPDPKPEPTPGPYWIIVLEETDSRIAETAKILQDKAFWKSQTDAGHKWRFYDDDATEAQAFANLTTHRPALILTTFFGEVVKTMKLPADAAGIKKVIQEASGQ